MEYFRGRSDVFGHLWENHKSLIPHIGQVNYRIGKTLNLPGLYTDCFVDIALPLTGYFR
jgi:hypothetical protein